MRVTTRVVHAAGRKTVADGLPPPCPSELLNLLVLQLARQTEKQSWQKYWFEGKFSRGESRNPNPVIPKLLPEVLGFTSIRHWAHDGKGSSRFRTQVLEIARVPAVADQTAILRLLLVKRVVRHATSWLRTNLGPL